MSRRHDVQDATGIIEQYMPFGRLQSWRDGSGTSPTNGVQGHAPGAMFQDIINGQIWINKGTFLSSLWQPLNGYLYSNTAPSTAITNTVTETAFSTNFTLPANSLRAGAVVSIYCQGIQTAENGTDTLAIKLYIGGLSGTALVSIAAGAGAANNIFAIDTRLIIRTVGASGTFVGSHNYVAVPAAAGTATRVEGITASTAIDTTVAQQIVASATWGAASAGDSVRMDEFIVSIM